MYFTKTKIEVSTRVLFIFYDEVFISISFWNRFSYSRPEKKFHIEITLKTL